jgi:hypothetical protein
MTAVGWWQISPIDAEAYRDHVERRGRARLIDLAHQMRATDGPLAEMDGRPESLVALWEWYLRMRDEDFPGTPEDAAPSAVVFLGLEGLSRQQLRAGYVAESLEHYLFEVANAFAGDAQWAVSRERPSTRVIVEEANRTGIVSSARGFLSAQEILWRFAIRASDGQEIVNKPMLLRNLFGDEALWSRRPEQLLLQLSNEPVVSVGDPIRQPPRRVGELVPAPTREGLRSFALVLSAIGSEADEDPSSMVPINEAAVARFLKKIKFTSDGNAPSATMLSSSDVQLTLDDGGVVAETYAAGGRLRGISFEPFGPYLATWERLERDIRRFAGRHALVIRVDES